MSPNLEIVADSNCRRHSLCNTRGPARDGIEVRELSRHLRTNVAGLRRFVGIFTGNHRFANLCVVRLIDEVAAEPGVVSLASTPRIGLFRLLLCILNEFSEAAAFVDNGRDILCPDYLVRQAYLLSAIEGFSPKDIAEILDLTVECVDQMSAQFAQTELTAPQAQILVIEDEPLIAWQIERLVDQLGHRILGVATTRKQAAKFLRNVEPDILLADVQLADGSTGIDTVADILAHINVPAIFVTADPDRLNSGQLVEPLFVVAKPFIPVTLKAVISHALFLSNARRQL